LRDVEVAALVRVQDIRDGIARGRRPPARPPGAVGRGVQRGRGGRLRKPDAERIERLVHGGRAAVVARGLGRLVGDQVRRARVLAPTSAGVALHRALLDDHLLLLSREVVGARGAGRCGKRCQNGGRQGEGTDRVVHSPVVRMPPSARQAFWHIGTELAHARDRARPTARIGAMEPTRERAWETLTRYTKSESLLRHALAVEASTAAYARKFGEDEELWRVAALLHDFDYEMHPTLDKHPQDGAPILREEGYPEEVVETVLSHAEHLGLPRDTPLKRALFAYDELSGFVHACALVRPMGLEGLEPKSVRKKLKIGRAHV